MTEFVWSQENIYFLYLCGILLKSEDTGGQCCVILTPVSGVP